MLADHSHFEVDWYRYYGQLKCHTKCGILLKVGFYLISYNPRSNVRYI